MGMYACEYVYTCVCEREKERDTERKKIGIRGDTCYKGFLCYIFRYLGI